MKENLSVLICSCDNFSDLWKEHVRLYRENWKGAPLKTYLVTDKPTDMQFEGIETIVAPAEYDFPKRIRYALQCIETAYVLVTLDDYFVIHPVQRGNILYLSNYAEKENVDYLMLYDRRRDKPKHFASTEVLERIDLEKKYAVTLYPAIWKKEFLAKTVKKDDSPWQYEVSLTKTARENGANCLFSPTGNFRILDVVRKGKVLRKADKYFKKHGIDVGDRPKVGRFAEWKLGVMDWLDWHAPRWVVKALKKIGRLFGMKFYSE